jgi:hypothetical protein
MSFIDSFGNPKSQKSNGFRSGEQGGCRAQMILGFVKMKKTFGERSGL